MLFSHSNLSLTNLSYEGHMMLIFTAMFAEKIFIAMLISFFYPTEVDAIWELTSIDTPRSQLNDNG